MRQSRLVTLSPYQVDTLLRELSDVPGSQADIDGAYHARYLTALLPALRTLHPTIVLWYT